MHPLILACAGALAVCLVGETRDVAAAKIGGKLGASAAFLAYAVSLGVPDASPHGTSVMAALVLGAAGDAFLLSTEKKWFLAGLVAFLFSHVAYVVAFVQLSPAWPWALGAAVPLVAFAYGVWRWLGPHVGSMAKPVMAYIVVITSMVALAVGVAADGEVARILLAVAAVLFFVSDLFVARQRFVAPGSVNRLVGLPLYYGAQLLFAYAAAGVA